MTATVVTRTAARVPAHLRRTPRRVAAALAAAALTLPLAAFAAPAAQAHGTRPQPPAPVTSEYLPGVEADLHLPARPARGRVPVVVMIPGGGWQTADRSGLGQLAEALAARGVAVSNATYRISGEGTRFPVPAQDVRCAVDAGVDAVRRAGYRPGPVVVLGHSAGAHLSSLAAFGDDAFRTDACPYRPVEIDGWVGLSGIYDLRVVGQWAWPMMGATAEEAPELYAAAATETYLVDRPRQHLDALVVQGDADELLLDTAVAEDFAALLRDHGYDTRLRIVPGDHNATFQAPVVADHVLSWLCRVRD
ncbi:alpha/beta hydrolase [Cellulomonas fimi]|uniref:BD-FAE-like domain-containing protein n=1 Tax=Cellulomonas fimi (strain ATCC 484 / DSM 20113 / JCM 1341 / CCUG 24087 / LMG 16345 / NBRC 15513 / NCIMB 8980 / NCTC 7547 / NRS-133) TaxID=590998 RepID=F4H5K3_CELFA|nr:alpha/beta hydrolase [Cellulomonas fimi]AEE44327.1 hypothetical protein Celf_0181 [Cellulomonas fimi ATCC 484]NNH08148.1 alpha/beta hydrolase [Cellulomonas fimi]VEH26132.1 Predicted dienelactone hydrolase [Cellulomonas fimi]